MRRENAHHIDFWPRLIDQFQKLAPRDIAFSLYEDNLFGPVAHSLMESLRGLSDGPIGLAVQFCSVSTYCDGDYRLALTGWAMRPRQA